MKSVDVPIGQNVKLNIDESGVITFISSNRDLDLDDILIPKENTYEQALGLLVAKFLIHYSQLTPKDE